MRQRPTDGERQAAREYLEHDYARRTLSGKPAEEAHRNAQEVLGEHPRARAIALAGTATELGHLPPHLRGHQLRERRAVGISSNRAAELRRQGFPEHTPTRRRARRERLEDLGDTARARARDTGDRTGRALELADTGGWGATIGDVFLAAVGLSVFYLLITKAASAGKLGLGLINVARAIISPVIDPLNPRPFGEAKYAPAGVSASFSAETAAAVRQAPPNPTINTRQESAAAIQAQTVAAVIASQKGHP